MSSIGLAFALLASMPATPGSEGHVVAWGDTTSPLIRQFPDSLAAPRWVRACGNRSLAYRSNRKLTWWGANALDASRSPIHRMALRSVACSDELSLGLTDSGTVFKWGPAPSMGDPTPPAGLRDVVQIGAGMFHAVALKKDGSVVAWGGNLDSVVSKTDGKTGIAAISANGVHTVLLRKDSTVEVAGGKISMVDQVPVGLAGVVAVAAGGRHVLALKADGKVVGWGDAAGTAWKAPSDLDSVVDIAAGGYHSLALRRDGGVVCWGSNDKGQCDIPSTVVDVVAISAGLDHSLALRRDGKVVAWGADAQGQCDVPMKTILVESIHIGRNAAVAVLADGRVVAWGSLPSEPMPALPVGRRWKSFSFGGAQGMGIDDQDKIHAWGPVSSVVGKVPDSITSAKALEAGSQFTMVLTPENRLIGWGEERDGVLANAALLENVVQFDLSMYRGIARLADSTVHVWGWNATPGVDLVPDSANGSIAVAAGDNSFYSLRSDGKVFVWNNRQALIGWHRPPAGLDSVVSIVAGSVHALALRADGKVVCWGDSSSSPCVVPFDLPPASRILTEAKVALALVPMPEVRGPVSRIATLPSPSRKPVGFRGDAGGLMLEAGGRATIAVFDAEGHPVVASKTLVQGERFGSDLPRGIYFVRVVGEGRSFRWVRLGR